MMLSPKDPKHPLCVCVCVCARVRTLHPRRTNAITHEGPLNQEILSGEPPSLTLSPQGSAEAPQPPESRLRSNSGQWE